MAAATETFSYATPDHPPLQRMVIRLIESMTGQRHITQIYLSGIGNRHPNESFWDWSVRQLELKVAFNPDGLAQLPRTGAVVVVANHPFGVLDGLVICHLIGQVRPDFRVLAIDVLGRAEEVRSQVLPVDFAETGAALENNLRTRAEAKRHLLAGGCIIVFPAGEVSTTPSFWATRAIDAQWKTLTARLILQSKADVVPIYFAGQNSLLFQMVSHISMTLRTSLLLKELHRRIGSEVKVCIGEPIPHAHLATIGNRASLMAHLRNATYALGESTSRA
jgi:putative hemolysin